MNELSESQIQQIEAVAAVASEYCKHPESVQAVKDLLVTVAKYEQPNNFDEIAFGCFKGAMTISEIVSGYLISPAFKAGFDELRYRLERTAYIQSRINPMIRKSKKNRNNGGNWVFYN